MQRFLDRIKKILINKGYDRHNINFPLIAVVLLLSLISVFTIYVIGSGYNTSADYKKQIFGLSIGLVFMIVFSIVDYHFICKFVIIYYIVVIGLVAATRYSPLGTDNTTGAYRWLHFPGFDLQPSELCKLMIIFVLAVLFNKSQNKTKSFIPLILAIVLTAVPLFFILKQPDLSSSLVVLFILIVMIFASGMSYKILLPFAAVGIPGASFFTWYALQPGSKILTDYQVGRIIGFLNPDKYSEIMFQQNYSIDAIASGKLYGKYILEGASSVRNYNYVDVTESDFIWSAIGEEFGFIGCILLITIFIVFIIMCILVSRKAIDYLGKIIAIGISSMFMFQVFVNIGVATRMLPNTGLPLPFISAGLTSVCSCMMAVGVLINIGLNPPSKTLGKGFLIKNEPVDLSKRDYYEYERHIK